MPALKAYSVGMKTKQYTIRRVPQRVDEAARLRAWRENKSLNQVLLDALQSGLGVSGEKKIYHDLDALAGSWVEDPEFDGAMQAFEAIDEDLWK